MCRGGFFELAVQSCVGVCAVVMGGTSLEEDNEQYFSHM